MLRMVVPPSRRIFSRYGPTPAYLGTLKQTRTLADKPSINDPKPPVLPGSQSKTAVPAPPPPGPVPPVPAVEPRAPLNAPISTQNPPLVPPKPPVASTTGSSSPPLPPPPPPPAPKKRSRRLSRYLLYLVLLTGLGFGGGVWYSMVSDNFHDFFTEYVPFGEDAVLYFEEREFRRRFPKAMSRPPRPSESAPRVTIPGKSGISSKITEVGGDKPDANKIARQSNALADTSRASSPPKTETKSQPQTPRVVASEKVSPKASSAEPSSTKVEQYTSPAKEAASSAASAGAPAGTGRRMPEVDEPSVYIPVTRIDPLNIPNANEPLVQDLVKLLNDIILVVNSDNRSSQMASTIGKAKGELAKVGQRIMDMKKAEQSDAQEKIKSSEAQFDNAARELVRRLEEDLREQESKWREELEAERKKLNESYEDRFNSEARKLGKIADQQTRNELLGQAVALKKNFASLVQDKVESERNGRLARLSELSSSVDELERLASAWNAVIDSNLQTQHLQVTVEAVRAHIERSEGLRPFIKELAALKEIAVDDAVIGSAIASINPVAYQRGIPSPAQLIDRFRSVADEVRKASLLPDDAGVTSHAASFLASKVMFKKQGKALGDDVESVLTRTETFLEEGCFDEAAREMNSLTGWAKTLSRDWLAELRRVLEVRQALDIISTEARLQSLKVD